MTCELIHRRAIGDTLSHWPVKLTRSGVAADLTGLDVKFVLRDADGADVIPETNVGIAVTDAAAGELDFDFPSSAFAEAAAAVAADPTIEEVKNYGFFKVYTTGGSEPDTYPEDPDGILVIFFNPAIQRVAETPSINIIEAANSPRRVRTVEGTVEERGINDLIAADRYQAGKDAANAPPWGMRLARTKPPSSLG